MKVSLKRVSGKNWGLHFEGAPIAESLYEDIKNFIRYNTQYLDAPHSVTVKKASPFIQSDCEDYLFVEFWSDPSDFGPFVALVKDKFCLNVEIG